MIRTFSFILFIAIILLYGCTYSQSTKGPDAISFELIPFEAPDILSPGRGAEQWHNGSEAIPYPGSDSTALAMDVYYRFTWNMLEDSVQDHYRFDYFDGLLHDAIEKGQKLSFGIMTCYGDDVDGVKDYDGGKSAYPLYLHRLMQAGDESERDWLTETGIWVPNWNSPYYLNRLRALHEALYKHIMEGSYSPTQGPHAGETIAYRNVIYCIDVRGYGHYGEWHNAGLLRHVKDYPKERSPTAATLKKIIDHHTEVFDRWPLVMMIAAFDAEQVGNIMNPAEVGYYALTTRNDWGPLGWRRDQWGATDSYLDDILKKNRKRSGNGPRLRELITTRFKEAPVTGEPPRYVNDDGHCPYWNLEQQVIEYGASSIGNGNWGIEMKDCARENARKAFKRTGYRLILEEGKIQPSIKRGEPLTITLHWRNIGVAPTYEEWDVIYQITNNNNQVIWSNKSKFSPKLFLPQKEVSVVTETFGLPQDILPGEYNLELIIKDPGGYRSPLPLAIQGRNPDGSYLLRKIEII